MANNPANQLGVYPIVCKALYILQYWRFPSTQPHGNLEVKGIYQNTRDAANEGLSYGIPDLKM